MTVINHSKCPRIFLNGWLHIVLETNCKSAPSFLGSQYCLQTGDILSRRLAFAQPTFPTISVLYNSVEETRKGLPLADY